VSVTQTSDPVTLPQIEAGVSAAFVLNPQAGGGGLLAGIPAPGHVFLPSPVADRLAQYTLSR
jgi:hypothetical protein